MKVSKIWHNMTNPTFFNHKEVWTLRWRDGWMDRRKTKGWIYRQMVGYMDDWWTDMQRDGRTNKWTVDERTDGQIDRVKDGCSAHANVHSFCQFVVSSAFQSCLPTAGVFTARNTTFLPFDRKWKSTGPNNQAKQRRASHTGASPLRSDSGVVTAH